MTVPNGERSRWVAAGIRRADVRPFPHTEGITTIMRHNHNGAGSSHRARRSISARRSPVRLVIVAAIAAVAIGAPLTAHAHTDSGFCAPGTFARSVADSGIMPCVDPAMTDGAR